MASSGDAYLTLGISPTASDAEVRSAYRRLVQLHHPDHNGGSPESERRFEEVQEAYAAVRALRAAGTGSAAGGGPTAAGVRATTSGPAGADPDFEARLAKME